MYCAIWGAFRIGPLNRSPREPVFGIFWGFGPRRGGGGRVRLLTLLKTTLTPNKNTMQKFLSQAIFCWEENRKLFLGKRQFLEPTQNMLRFFSFASENRQSQKHREIWFIHTVTKFLLRWVWGCQIACTIGAHEEINRFTCEMPSLWWLKCQSDPKMSFKTSATLRTSCLIMQHKLWAVERLNQKLNL